MGTISVSLPSDGTGADVSDYNTPITTIVNAINGNLDNSNLSAGAAISTSKLAADNGISAGMISSTAISLAYTKITTNFSTTSTTDVQVTGLTASPIIPAGSRNIKITVFVRSLNNGSAGYQQLTIWDGTVGSGTKISEAQVYVPGANQGSGITAVAIVVPSAGSKTYNVGLRTTTGTSLVECATTYPAFILVEAI